MCALETLSAVMPVLTTENVSEMVVPTLVKACNDRIPNVQFCVARIIKLHVKKFDDDIFINKVMPCLKTMAVEADKDVAYFSHIAIQAYQEKNK